MPEDLATAAARPLLAGRLRLIYTMVYLIGGPMTTMRAKVFWTGRSQAVRLPKEFRFDTETVLIRREGDAVVLEPARGWPEDYAESFADIPSDLQRHSQGKPEKREPFE
jgi:antitoxin VapB